MNVFELPEHPAASVFPMMSEAELNGLADDIGTNGLRDAVTICRLDGEWLLLDGRNRREACRRAGVECASLIYKPEGGHVEFVVSRNIHRRHLTDGQRAVAAARLANLSNGQTVAELTRGRSNSAVSIETAAAPTTIAQAAKLLNVTRSNVNRAKEVLKTGTPELVGALERGEVSVSAAAAVAKLPVEVQQKAVAEKTVAAMAKDIRETAKAERTIGVAFVPGPEAPSFGPPRGDPPDTMADSQDALDELDKLVSRWWSHGFKSTSIQYSMRELIRGWSAVEAQHPDWKE